MDKKKAVAKPLIIGAGAFWGHMNEFRRGALKDIPLSKLCIAYAFLSILSASGISIMEGSFSGMKVIETPTGAVSINPFVSNYSTIFDFILLNPITIFFLELSIAKSKEISKNFGKNYLLSPYHFGGALVLSSVTAGAMMSYYYKGFLEGDFLDSVVSINEYGDTFITYTGWIVYFWTAFFIAVVLFKTMQIFSYVIFVLQIEKEELHYKPYHEDEAAGLSEVMSPLITFSYAMISLLIIFFVFAIYDTKLNVDESNRLYAFYIYLSVIIPLFFFPFWRLHKLMLSKRKKYLCNIAEHAPNFPESKGFGLVAKDTLDLKEFCEKIENVQKLRSTLLSFPIWPVPIKNVLGLQLITVFISLLPQITKLTSIFGAGTAS